MRRILTEIHQAPGRAWRVDELATLAHCSRSVFTAKFRRQIGTSPMAYINHWRLHKAHALLVETAYPIYTVSDLIGYANTSSFIKAFRRKFGATPMGVRERAQSVSD